MTLFTQYAVDAIGVGALYALMSLSIALLFNVMGLINLAYGDLFMIGGYTMYALRNAPIPVIIVATIGATTLASVLMERVAFRPVRDADLTTLLVTSFAVSTILESLALVLFGSTAFGITAWGGLDGNWVVAGVYVSRLSVVSIVVAVILLVALALFQKRTLLGVQLRASTENFRMARLVGVRANMVIASAFAITGGLAGIVAVLFMQEVGTVTPTVGFAPTLVAFVGAVIGGLGGVVPAAIGGFALGAVTTGLQAALPVSVGIWTQTLAFVCVLGVLLVRPAGLAARTTTGVT